MPQRNMIVPWLKSLLIPSQHTQHQGRVLHSMSLLYVLLISACVQKTKEIPMNVPIQSPVVPSLSIGLPSLQAVMKTFSAKCKCVTGRVWPEQVSGVTRAAAGAGTSAVVVTPPFIVASFDRCTFTLALSSSAAHSSHLLSLLIPLSLSLLSLYPDADFVSSFFPPAAKQHSSTHAESSSVSCRAQGLLQ